MNCFISVFYSVRSFSRNMSSILWICTALLAINAASSYVLLTANVDDVQAIAKQVGDSQVAKQLAQVWRRATQQFKRQLDGLDDAETEQRSRSHDEDVYAIGRTISKFLKNAKAYLRQLHF